MKNEGGQGGAEGHGQFPVVSPTSARMGANVPHIRRTENRTPRIGSHTGDSYTIATKTKKKCNKEGGHV